MGETVEKTYQFLENFEKWLIGTGLSDQMAQLTKVAISLFVIIALSVAVNYIAKHFIVVWLNRIAKRTPSNWNTFMIKRKVLHKLSHLAPALVIQFTIGIALYDFNPNLTTLIEKLTYVYIAVIWLLVIDSLLNVLHDMYLVVDTSKSKPVKGYIQFLKIILYILGGVVIISILFNKSPRTLLVGMGASVAVLTLIFKDTILGLVASVQVSTNNLVKPGDWIEMPGRNVDGTVIDISLTAVKVQNWDRTISTIPTYSLVSDGFINWKGMLESDGRRIKRSVYIDVRSVKFCSPELLEKLKRIHLIKDYIEQRSEEIEEYNLEMGFDTTMPVNGRRLTNLGIFRKYVNTFLENNPNISKQSTHMVRHLQLTERGIPIEIYCFSLEKAWVDYEGIQADIFDHILAVIPQFELQVFQNPTGDDFQKIVN